MKEKKEVNDSAKNGKETSKDKKKVEEYEQELSEEDKQLQDELQMLVTRLQEPNAALYLPSLEALRVHIRSATTSMTSVPKPLKFLRPHYATLKSLFTSMPNDETKRFLADIISI